MFIRFNKGAEVVQVVLITLAVGVIALGFGLRFISATNTSSDSAVNAQESVASKFWMGATDVPQATNIPATSVPATATRTPVPATATKQITLTLVTEIATQVFGLTPDNTPASTVSGPISQTLTPNGTVTTRTPLPTSTDDVISTPANPALQTMIAAQLTKTPTPIPLCTGYCDS